MSASLLPEFDLEMANTRRVLERVPDGKAAWQPHQRSMTLGRLASHLAELPSWCTNTFNRTELDLTPPGAPPHSPTLYQTSAELLQVFDKNAKEARAALAGAQDGDFMVPWSLKKGGTNLLTLPRVAVYRSLVMNHMIHHRAQLGVFLRLLDVPIPPLYGPTADEGMM
jgi:uncharacterized damage-inducible protein DinB